MFIWGKQWENFSKGTKFPVPNPLSRRQILARTVVCRTGNRSHQSERDTAAEQKLLEIRNFCGFPFSNFPQKLHQLSNNFNYVEEICLCFKIVPHVQIKTVLAKLISILPPRNFIFDKRGRWNTKKNLLCLKWHSRIFLINPKAQNR